MTNSANEAIMQATEMRLIDISILQREHLVENKVEEYVKHAGSVLYTVIFGFFTTQNGVKDLMVKPMIHHLALQLFLFPAAALLEIIEAGAAWSLLYRSRNRNLGKTLDALSKLEKALIVVPAVVLGVVGTVLGIASLMTVVPYLFVIAMGFNTLHQFGQFLRSVRRFYKSPSGSALREMHRQRMTVTGIRSLSGAVMTTAVYILFVVAITTPIGLGVTAGVAIATLLTVTAIACRMKINAKKRAELARTRPSLLDPVNAQAQETDLQQKINIALDSNATKQEIYEATVAGASNLTHDYYYVRNLAQLLDAADRDGGPSKQREVFVRIIKEKIERLNTQIAASEDPHQWFIGFHRDQNLKRIDKREALESLRDRVSRLNPRQEKLDDGVIDRILDSHPLVFQSFFKDKGDVEVIFDAAKECFSKPPKVETSKKNDISMEDPDLVCCF